MQAREVELKSLSVLSLLKIREVEGALVILSITPRLCHSSMECRNPGWHGCLRKHPCEPGCRLSVPAWRSSHFHSL